MSNLYGVASQYNNVSTSYRPSTAEQRSDWKQERSRIFVESQFGVPSSPSGAVGANLNTTKFFLCGCFVNHFTTSSRPHKVPSTWATRVLPEGDKHPATPPAGLHGWSVYPQQAGGPCSAWQSTAGPAGLWERTIHLSARPLQMLDQNFLESWSCSLWLLLRRSHKRRGRAFWPLCRPSPWSSWERAGDCGRPLRHIYQKPKL